MSLGAYESEVGRGSVLNALAHPIVANPVAAMGQGVQLASNVTALRQAQFNLQQAQLQPTYQAMRMLQATNPNPSYEDVTAALGGAARLNGNIDGVTQNLADWTARGGKVSDFVRAYSAGGMSPEAQATAFAQHPVTADTGSNILFGTQGGILSGDPGRFTLGTSIARGLSPGEATATRNVVDPQTGQVRQVPVGAAYGTPYGGGGGGAGGRPPAAPAGPPPGSSVQPGQPLSQKDADLATFAQRESGNQNILSRVPVPPGYTQNQAGSGYYQIIPSTWAEGQQLAGIPPQQRTQMAMQASPQQQYAVASALYDKYGGKPWAQSAPQGGGAVAAAPSGSTVAAGPGGAQSGPFIGTTSVQPVGPGGAVVQPGVGAGANVRTAAAPQYLDATGRPAGQGGGGGLQIPGMTNTPQGPVFTSPPPAAADNLQADITARNQASMGAADQQRTLQAGESALEALRLAKGYTGPGTDFSARAYAFLQAHDPTGALPQGNMTDTAWRQILAKNLLRFAQNSGLRGNTDLGLTEQLKGSANVDEMLPTANEHVLIQDISLARQRMAQTMLMPQPSIQGDVVDHFKSYTGNTDYRGFGWDLMSQPQRDAIEAEAKKSGPAAVARLTKAIRDGIAAGVTKPPQAPSGAAP